MFCSNEVPAVHSNPTLNLQDLMNSLMITTLFGFMISFFVDILTSFVDIISKKHQIY